MLDPSEQDRIAEKLENDQRRILVEQAAAERANALRLGQEHAVERTGRILDGLGYEPEDKRAAAARARKDAAEKRAAEKDDDGDGKAEARKQPPADRRSPADKQTKADPPGRQSKG